MPWTDPATWTVGELVLASKMNTHVRDNLNATTSVRIVKAADESVTSSTVLQDDDHLFIPIAANEVWFVDFVLRHIDNSSSVADLKIAFTVPSGATMSFQCDYEQTASTASVHHWTTSGAGEIVNSTNVVRLIRIPGIVANSTTAGNIRLQWAQGTSNASSVQIKANSILIATKLA